MSTSNGDLTDRPSAPSTVEAIMARVRARLPATAGRTSAPSASRGGANEAYLFPEDVYRNLHQARTIAGSLNVDYQVGWRTPVIGHAWMIVRRRIHQELRIYVDAMTTHQNALNAYLLRALTQVVETLDGIGLRALRQRQSEQEGKIESLEAEVRELRAHVEALQAHLAAPNGADGATGASPGA
jgi:hypothetical protein